jgi:K+-transporting ATPase ATPase A chain
MQLGEVIFGGVGSGLYGLLVFAIVAVFMAGLMVGRTPEYLGKKSRREMKMAALIILMPSVVVLLGTAAAAATAAMGPKRRHQPRPPRLQRDPVRLLLRGQQQRQRLRRPDAARPFYTIGLGLAMLIARFWL